MIGSPGIQRELEKARDRVMSAIQAGDGEAGGDLRVTYLMRLEAARAALTDAITISEQSHSPARAGSTGSPSDSSTPHQAASDRPSADQ